MPSVTYNYIPDQSVFVISDGTVKAGIVSLVDIEVDITETRITYWIQVDGDAVATPYDEINVFESCRTAPGYQDVVFLTALAGSPSELAVDLTSPLLTGSPLPTVGSPPVLTLTADVHIDDALGSPLQTVTLTHAVTGTETFADLVTEINTQLGTLAEATLYQNNIRITSATKGITSSIRIGTGSPVSEDYFRALNGFTGLAAAVAGLDEGALETLSNQLCVR